jgi:hypothetical protein
VGPAREGPAKITGIVVIGGARARVLGHHLGDGPRSATRSRSHLFYGLLAYDGSRTCSASLFAFVTGVIILFSIPCPTHPSFAKGAATDLERRAKRSSAAIRASSSRSSSSSRSA